MSENPVPKRRALSSAMFVPVLLLGLFLGVGLWGLVTKHAYTPPAPNAAVLELPTFPPGSGKLYNLNQMHGEKFLVNFFASWCVPCIAEIPVLKAISTQQAIPIIGVAYNDTEVLLGNFIDKNGNPYVRILMDGGGRAAIDWGVTGVPETFLIDEKGNVIAKHSGPLTLDAWNAEFARFIPSRTTP